MNILILGTALGLLLGLIMVVTLILPALRERKRTREFDHDTNDPSSVVDEQSGAEKRALAMNREDIWNRGCRGEVLGQAEQEEFNYLARARFYTFQMGISHAADDTEKSTLLIRGMAVELDGSPGLERLWHQSAASNDPAGQAVNARLLELQTRSPDQSR